MNFRRLPLALTVAVASLGTACDGGDKKSKSDATTADSAKPKTNLEKAIQGAAAASAAASSQGQGPPQNGVFAPGAADAEQAASAPPKLTMVRTGDGPKVTLERTPPQPGSKFVASVTATAFLGPLPGMIYELEVGGGKADAKAKAAAKADATSDDAGERRVVIKIKSAKLDPKWPGKLQEGGEKLLAKLAGGTISGVLGDDGGLRGPRLEVGKDATEVAPIAEPLLEMLDVLFVPLPAEPVSSGASWLVADRARLGGIDVVRYRAATLQKLEGDVVVLGVDVRHYAASSASVPEGLPSGVEALRLESFAQATLTRRLADSTSLGAKLSLPVDLVIGKGGNPAGQLRSELRAVLEPVEGGK
ncbi:MAG: hypothetical protein FJ095_15455 [Deltaproteobacteria bacterium]|nr:hypothetical protein [Deltaproteobacteria bacterium]